MPRAASRPASMARSTNPAGACAELPSFSFRIYGTELKMTRASESLPARKAPSARFMAVPAEAAAVDPAAPGKWASIHWAPQEPEALTRQFDTARDVSTGVVFR